jgi:hypothetical protein
MRRIAALMAAVAIVSSALPAAAAKGGDRVVVSEAGGLSPTTMGAVMLAVSQAGSFTRYRATGSMRLMGVTRGDLDVQRPAPGFGFPMAVAAYQADDPRLGADAAAILHRHQAVMSARSAQLRGARVGDVLELEGWNKDVVEVEIGAILDDPELDWYEIAIDSDTAAELAFDRRTSVVIAGGDLGTLTDSLDRFLPVDTLARVSTGSSGSTPSEDDPLPTVVVKQVFGEFSFRPTGVGDNIEIDRAWREANIVDVFIPELGPFKCNRAVVPYIRAAVDELARRGLDSEIDYRDFQLAGGCFNSRMARGGTTNKGFALSRHAWGIAIDINPSTNKYGDQTTLSKGFGDVFRRWGFAWGAGWGEPDPMHFEWSHLPDLIDVCADVQLVKSTDVAYTVEPRQSPCS